MSPRIVDGRPAAIRTHGGAGLIACSSWYGLRTLRALLGHGPVTESRVPGIVAWLRWCDGNGEWEGDWHADTVCDSVLLSLLDGACSDSAEWHWLP